MNGRDHVAIMDKARNMHNTKHKNTGMEHISRLWAYHECTVRKKHTAVVLTVGNEFNS